MPPTADPATVKGLSESTLPPAQLAALPTEVPPAPWEAQAHAMMWVQRGRAPAFDWLGWPTGTALAGFVQYLDTPVGTYQEVLAGSLVRRGARPLLQVPFIAVDSVPSIAGGRANWALPKTIARFETDLEAGTARVEGEGWSITVEPVRGGRRPQRLPLRSRFASIGPLGVYSTRMRASGRLVRVRTRAEGPTLTGWLGQGTHLALVLTGRMSIEAPH
jgi:hypothetical protein